MEKQNSTDEAKVVTPEKKKQAPVVPWMTAMAIGNHEVTFPRWVKGQPVSMRLVVDPHKCDPGFAAVAAREHFRLATAEELSKKSPKELEDLNAIEAKIDDEKYMSVAYACEVVPAIITGTGPTLSGDTVIEKALELRQYLSDGEIRDLVMALRKRDFSSFT